MSSSVTEHSEEDAVERSDPSNAASNIPPFSASTKAAPSSMNTEGNALTTAAPEPSVEAVIDPSSVDGQGADAGAQIQHSEQAVAAPATPPANISPPSSLSPPTPPPKDDHLVGKGKFVMPMNLVGEDFDSTSAWNEGREYNRVEASDSTSAWNERREDNHREAPRDSHTPDFDEKRRAESEGAEESRPEIQNILQQFEDGQDEQSNTVVASPTTPELPIFQYPPRVSSLEHLGSPLSPATESSSAFPANQDPEKASLASLSHAPSITSQPPLPEPDPEPDLPFDFHRFLEQLRSRSADPVAKFLRSFLMEFGKKQWQVHEQTKIIRDFLTFISGRMGQCEVWRNVSDAEFDNAREGMEKLVMNRLYVQTFSPEIPPAEPLPGKARRKGTAPVNVGRRGQHQEDVERDEVLAQKVRIYGWIREEHLDIKPFGDKGRKFLLLAQQELSKIKSYRAPRDKVICVLNCCKVLFGFLKNAKSDQSADEFIPLLIFTVLKSNPEHLVSNVQYIVRFRNPDKLTGEAGYYMSSLMGAIQFIENLDRTNLTISDEEFEKNVEAAVSSIAERDEQQEKRQTSSHLHFNEKSAPSRPEVTTHNSQEGERSSPRRVPQRSTDTPNEDENDENAAVAGLLRTIQKPLSTIGRIFSDDSGSTTPVPSGRPPLTPQPNLRPPRTTSIPPNNTNNNEAAAAALPGTAAAAAADTTEEQEQARLAADVAAARQASAETAQAHQLMRAEHQTVVETLSGMFPGLDKDIISDVVRMKEGQVGQAVDACLALSR